MKMIIGLTGQTGAGKSSLSHLARDNGYLVIDCDKVAREIRKKSEVILAIKNAFGSSVLDKNGNIDKAALAAKAFSSSNNTALLNKTILPFIKTEINSIIEKSSSQKILLDAPTLFEADMQDICRYTVGVIADRDIRLARIMARDNIDADSANKRINAGKNDDFYKQNCDFIIENSNDITSFLNNFQILLKTISGGN